MVVRSGKLFYFGSLSGLSESLHTAGKGCPNEFNLADHVMFVLQTESTEALDKIESVMKGATDVAGEPSVPHDKSAMAIKLDGAHAGFFGQLHALTKREAQNLWRDKPGLIASVMVPLILNVFFACIFFQVGDHTREEWSAQSHFGGMTQVAIGGMFGAAQPLLLKFPLDRGIFLREYATQTYGAAPYFISKSMVEVWFLQQSNFLDFNWFHLCSSQKKAWHLCFFGWNQKPRNCLKPSWMLRSLGPQPISSWACRAASSCAWVMQLSGRMSRALAGWHAQWRHGQFQWKAFP